MDDYSAQLIRKIYPFPKWHYLQVNSDGGSGQQFQTDAVQ
jgi:hypothetical protein